MNAIEIKQAAEKIVADCERRGMMSSDTPEADCFIADLADRNPEVRSEQVYDALISDVQASF